MAIFHVPYQKHVIFPIFEFEIKILAIWRFSVCLVRNMSFFRYSSSKLKFWSNDDIPCLVRNMSFEIIHGVVGSR